MPPYTPSPSKPHQHTRPLGPNETFIKLNANLSPSLDRKDWYINSFATLKPHGSLTPSLLPAHLRKAWAHLRFQQPSIAAYVAPDNKSLAYDVPDASGGLDEWLRESFSVDEEAENASEIVKTARVPKYWTCTFVKKSSEVLCFTAHWRSDGIGVLQLFDALFKLVAEPELSEPSALPWGEEVGRLAPSIENIAQIPEHPSKEQEELGRKCFATFGLAEGAVGIPCIGDEDTMPGGTCIAKTVLDEESTAEVVKKCKKLGVSVTSAVNASVAAANWQFASEERKDEHYTSTARFSFKPYLPPPYNGPSYASALLTTGWMVAVSPTESWEAHARYYNSIYRAGLSQDFINGYRVYAGALCDVLAPIGKADKAGPGSGIDSSSIGVVEKQMGREYGNEDWGLEVLDVGEGVEILGRQGVVFVWTFRGRLTLSTVFNEAFHGMAQMEEFNKGVKESLLRELGVVQWALE